MPGTVSTIQLSPAEVESGQTLGDRGFAVVMTYTDGSNSDTVEVYVTSKADLLTVLQTVINTPNTYDPFP